MPENECCCTMRLQLWPASGHGPASGRKQSFKRCRGSGHTKYLCSNHCQERHSRPMQLPKLQRTSLQTALSRKCLVGLHLIFDLFLYSFDELLWLAVKRCSRGLRCNKRTNKTSHHDLPGCQRGAGEPFTGGFVPASSLFGRSTLPTKKGLKAT